MVFHWLTLGAAWLHASPFAGNINFSEVMNPALAAEVKSYLVSQGLPLRENMDGVFVTNNPAFDAWRNIPTQRGPVVSRGHAAFFVYLSVRR